MNARRNAQLANRYQNDGMATASPRKLLVMVYERLLKDLDSARDAISAGQIEASHDALVHAQELIHELRLALDVEVWPAAEQLISVYDYVYDLLIQCNQEKTLEPLEECYRILLPLNEAWNTAYQEVQMGQSVGLGTSV